MGGECDGKEGCYKCCQKDDDAEYGNTTGLKANRYEQYTIKMLSTDMYSFVLTVHSFVEMVQYLFTLPDVTVFLSNHICQDPLEKFFGQQRQRGRVNENPNVLESLRNTQALRIVKTTCANIKGNCKGDRKRGIEDIENTPMPKRRCHHK